MIPGTLMTTAMVVMPHTDVERALQAALSLDVPFWPQLPNYSYYEEALYRKRGVLAWGIVPTGTEFFEKESMDSLIAQTVHVW